MLKEITFTEVISAMVTFSYLLLWISHIRWLFISPSTSAKSQKSQIPTTLAQTPKTFCWVTRCGNWILYLHTDDIIQSTLSQSLTKMMVILVVVILIYKHALFKWHVSQGLSISTASLVRYNIWQIYSCMGGIRVID